MLIAIMVLYFRWRTAYDLLAARVAPFKVGVSFSHFLLAETETTCVVALHSVRWYLLIFSGPACQGACQIKCVKLFQAHQPEMLAPTISKQSIG